MRLSDDLLEQAEHLAKREKKRPKQASLRRAVSAAYYAVFHLLTEEAVRVLAPDLTPSRKAGVQRWFEHAEMKRICQKYLSSTFTKPESLRGLTISDPLQTVARNFINLQAARHRADYDLSTAWTRIGAQQQIASAKSLKNAWEQVRGTEEANIFLLSLLLWRQFEQERS